jgi:hypothetical protein
MLKEGCRPILQKRLESKECKLIYDVGGGKMVKNVPVPSDDRNRFAIGVGRAYGTGAWRAGRPTQRSDLEREPLNEESCNNDERFVLRSLTIRRHGHLPLPLPAIDDGLGGLDLLPEKPGLLDS